MGCGASSQSYTFKEEDLPTGDPQGVEETRPALVSQPTHTSLHSQPTRPSLVKQCTKPINEDPKSQQFLDAAKSNNFTTLKAFASIVDLNIRDESTGNTALIWACQHGSLEMVEYLLEKKNKGMKWTDVDQKNKEGNTPLHEASSHGYAEIVSILLNHGASPDEVDALGRLPRDVAANAEVAAAFENHASLSNEVVDDVKEAYEEEEIDVGEEVQEKEIRDFFEAAMYGDLEKVKAYILLRHMDVNVRDMTDWTAVMAASQRGNGEVVKYLLDNKADPTLTNNSRATALHYADNGEIAQLLIDGGAPINAMNEFGETALHTACNAHFLSPGIMEVINILLANGSDCNLKNNEGQTPLHIAVRQENAHLVKLLMDKGADPSIKDAKEQTAMDLAKTDEIRYLM